jgi:hypothetical protein
MNKNIIKLFAILMMCFLIGSVLVACGSTNEDNEEVFTVDIVDGYWVINGVKTDVKAEGKDGANGLPGKDGADADSIRCEEHHWDPVYVTIAEHTQDTIGLFLKVCVDCDGAEVIRYDHVYDQKGETVAPTCTDAGYTVYSCICGKVDPATTERDVVAALGHKESEKQDVVPDPALNICPCEWDYPWYTECTVCLTRMSEGKYGFAHDGKGTEENPHVWGEYEDIKPGEGVNPCTWLKDSKKAACDNCDCHKDYKYGTEMKGHKEQEYTEHSIENDVLTLSYTCDDCGEKATKTFSLKACTDEKDSTCSEEGYCKVVVEYTVDGEKKTYTVKDDTIAKKPHTEIDVTGGAPTCDAPGLSAGKKCSVCGEVTKAQESVAALGHNNGAGINGANRFTVVVVNSVEYDAYWCDECDAWVAYKKH